MTRSIQKRRDKISQFFSSERNQRVFRNLTFLMFAFLVAEKVLSGATASYSDGHVSFAFSLSIADIISLMIYQTMTVLLAMHVRYKYLLIPDFALLGVKLAAIIQSAIALFSADKHTRLWESAQLEILAESLIFSLFLMMLFAGKLDRRHGDFHDSYPIYCLRLLLLCFIVTAGFEVLKAALAVDLHQYPFLIIFNFLKGLLGEAFLDLPYLLLILTVCFIPHPRDNTDHSGKKVRPTARFGI